MGGVMPSSVEALPGGRVSDELIAAVEAKLRGDEQRLTEMPTKRQIRKVLEAGRAALAGERVEPSDRIAWAAVDGVLYDHEQQRGPGNWPDGALDQWHEVRSELLRSIRDDLNAERSSGQGRAERSAHMSVALKAIAEHGSGEAREIAREALGRSGERVEGRAELEARVKCCEQALIRAHSDFADVAAEGFASERKLRAEKSMRRIATALDGEPFPTPTTPKERDDAAS